MKTRKNPQAGFTLAELMAVIILSSIATGFLYYLFIDQSRLARVQRDLGDMQTSLQFSVASISRDIRRAGYMSIVSTADQRLCRTYSGTDFNALRYTNTYLGVANRWRTVVGVPAAGNQMARPDMIEMFGNYTTTDDFPAYIDPANPSRIIVEFAGTEIEDLQAFETAFYSQNQLLLVKGQNGRLQVVQLDTSRPATNAFNVANRRGTLTVSSNMTFDTSTKCGVAIRFRVAPLLKIRYRLQANSATSWSLMREALDPGRCNNAGTCSGWTPLPANSAHPPLEIAPNAVDLQFWFTSWNRATNRPQNVDPLCSTTSVGSCNTGLNTVRTHNDTANTWPSDMSTIRSVFFRVSVRTENEDPTLQVVNQRSNADSTMVTFDVNPQAQGVARVRSIVKNVMVMNFLARQ